MSDLFGKLKDSARTVAASEAGAMSVLNLYFTIGLCIFGGVAIDTANLLAARNQLQVAADVAAHTALYSRGSMDANSAKTKGIELARANMPPGRYGEVLRTENIHFGTYDQSTKTFAIDETSTASVWVETDRLLENANPVSSFLLHFVGFTQFDVRTNGVFVKNDVPCIGNGFYGVGRVDMQSNNEYYNGFCIHSDTRVEINQNNYFEHDDGVVVTTPYRSDLILPADSWGNNEGLEHAYHDTGRAFNVEVDELITSIRDGMTDTTSDHYRSFVKKTGTNIVTVPNKNTVLDMSMLEPKKVNRVNCAGGTLKVAGERFKEVVVITDCNLQFGNGAILDEATFITESTDADSIRSPQGLQIGDDDGCLEGGGAQLVTFGGMKTAAKMQLYGGQIIASGDVRFAANGNGFAGASVIAGVEIDGPSNGKFGLCPGDEGMLDFFGNLQYLRLAG